MSLRGRSCSSPEAIPSFVRRLLRRHTCPGGQRQGKPRTAAHNDTPHWRTAQVSREVNYLQTLSFCSRLTYKNNSKKNKRGNLKYSLGCVSFQLKHSSRRFGKNKVFKKTFGTFHPSMRQPGESFPLIQFIGIRKSNIGIFLIYSQHGYIICFEFFPKHRIFLESEHNP